MKLSESWLREWSNPNISTKELVHQITMAGLEVDAVEPAAPEFSGVVIGQIESIAAHPDAEKLRVCQVSNGSETAQIVCGASNAAAGIKIPFAQVGAKLPPAADGKPFLIKKAKLRGVESFGMLCGASEIGLEDLVDGLMVLPGDAPLGEDVRGYLGLADSVIEVDLTPNRGDCLSVLGVAREVSVICDTDLSIPDIAAVPAAIDNTVAVTIEADDYCQAYAGRVVRNVNVAVETPLWMREKLRRGGIRSIDPVVDITNYVMLELGQPMHAFDLDQINGSINVRYAKDSEKIDLLDASSIEATDDLLVIADEKHALALAGIMGGASSAVSNKTKHILFEAAFFVPHKHAGKARGLGMHTDSSHRFERGVDWQGQVRAIERATQLLLDICGGEAGPVQNKTVAATDNIKIDFKRANIKRVLGFELEDAQVEAIFKSLDFSPVTNADGWQITAPSHRFDIEIEADLLEEIARIYGYDRLPVEPPVAAMTFTLKPESKLDPMSLRQTLVARGYSEAVTYTFIDPALHSALFGELSAIRLANPISEEMSVMRVSLIPGLLKAAEQNIKRQQSRLKLFETGLRFLPGDKAGNKNGDKHKDKEFAQESRIAGLVYGDRQKESWLSKAESVQNRGKTADSFDFYDLKSDVEALLSRMDRTAYSKVEFRSLVNQQGEMLDECASICSKMMHPGQSAAIFLGNQYLGFCGAIHPALQKTLDEVTSAWVFELDMALISQKKVPEFKGLSKFPEVRRDIAIIVDADVAVGQLLQAIYSEAGESLASAYVFDQYSGEGIEQGKQSVAVGLNWQHRDRTMTDNEVNEELDNIIASLSKQFKASLR